MSKLVDSLNAAFLAISGILFVYLIAICAFYFIIFANAFLRLKKEQGLHNVEPYRQVKTSAFTPPISIVVPAYNEEVGIVDTVLSLITGSGRLDYPEYEVIVVNDGSKDDSFDILAERFKLVPATNRVVPKRGGIGTRPIKGIYYSEIYPNLLLVDKENGGKSDALNAGINLAKYPYFASIDGDTILESDSLLKIMKPIVENDDQEILAAGGNVLIANSSKVEKGQMQELRLSRNPLIVMQTIEYMRAFLMGRIGLSKENLLLIVSGAFGVFKTSRVIQAGGYRTDTVGEDMELVVRLHRLNIENGWGAKIQFVADPVCYTEAPDSLTFLKRQRMRWHQGLFESLWTHRKMLFHPKYKGIGLIAMPYFVFVELLGPIVELLGYLIIAFGLAAGNVHLSQMLPLILLMIVYGSFLSMGAVLLEEWRLGKHQKLGDLNRLFFYALTESLWYRPLTTAWRFMAVLVALTGKRRGWGEMKRKGISA